MACRSTQHGDRSPVGYCSPVPIDPPLTAHGVVQDTPLTIPQRLHAEENFKRCATVWLGRREFDLGCRQPQRRASLGRDLPPNWEARFPFIPFRYGASLRTGSSGSRWGRHRPPQRLSVCAAAHRLLSSTGRAFESHLLPSSDPQYPTFDFSHLSFLLS